MATLAMTLNSDSTQDRLHGPPSSSDARPPTVRDIIQYYLRRCNIPYPNVVLDPDYQQECCDVAVSMGYPMNGRLSLQSYILSGVAMSEPAYGHIDDKRKRIFIALYTAALIYMDDIFEHDTQIIRDFNRCFVQNQRQLDGVLNAFAKMLQDMPYDGLVSNLITTATLNLISALSLEYETRGMNVSAEAINYPSYSRVMSGASEAYALFIFPSELPLPFYIQAVPDMMVYINQGNDILSFYKEDLAGDTVGYVMLVAAIQGVSKIQALQYVTSQVIEAYERILRILAPHPEAHEAFVQFASGYVGFHQATPRYRLDELKL